MREIIKIENDKIEKDENIELSENDLLSVQELAAYVEEENKECGNINFSGYLEKCGLPHDENIDTADAEAYSQYQGEIFLFVNDLFDGLPKKNRYVLNLNDYEYLRNMIYREITQRLESQEEDSQVVVMNGMIGEGGMGTVYDADIIDIREKAEQMGVKNLVVKKLNKKNFYFAKQGLELAQTLDHDNIMKVYNVDERAEDVIVYMERVAGQEINKNTSPEDFLVSISQAADGLEAMNKQGLIHRDIKFVNILYDKQEGGIKTKIIDLDFISTADSLREQVRRDYTCGTSQFMPPEGFFDIGKLKQIYIKAIFEGDASAKDEIQETLEIGDGELDGIPVSALRYFLVAKRDVFRRLEEIRKESKNENMARQAIENIGADIDSEKYDVYALGKMIELYTDRKRGEIDLKTQKRFKGLSQEMTKPILSERISISEVKKRLDKIKI